MAPRKVSHVCTTSDTGSAGWVIDREELLEQFCADAYSRLVAALAHYCGDVNLGEGLVQEALVVACRRLSTMSQLDEPVAWTYRVGVYKANSWLRRGRAEATCSPALCGGRPRCSPRS
jgi:DNA-directed RNA polymerase specialized sigma24 family protein